jgi:hypothetical protein
MKKHKAETRLGLTLTWYLAIGVAIWAFAGCAPPLPDNTPAATGEPVVAGEVVGHWFKLIGQGEPKIEIHPPMLQAVVQPVLDVLLSQIPEMSDATPLYIHVSDVLDEGGVADAENGVFVGIELPESLRVVPVEQPNGSLLFEGDNLMSFLDEVRGAQASSNPEMAELLNGIDLNSLPISTATVKLWFYRMAGSSDILFRISAEAGVEVPMVGAVLVRGTVDGTGFLSQGPEADGLEQVDMPLD